MIQCTVEFLHWVIKVITKLFCLKLGPYSSTKFFYYNWKGLSLAPFLRVEISVVNSASGSSCWNYATDTFYSNCAGTKVCCNMQFLRFCCNYVGGTFRYIYVGESFCCNYAGDCFYCNYVVRSFCSIYAGESVCSKYVGDSFYWNYARESLCCNHTGSIFYSALCTWLFLF